MCLAFIFPAVIMFLAFLANGIYWDGPTTILAGDGYHQYVEIATMYSNILHSHGQQGFFYTWTSGLGLNLYAFASYYMGSFFMPLSYFFNVKNMPDALYLFTLLKFGFIGLSSFISFRNMYKKVAPLLVLALSISFSLLSFLTSQNEIPMWQDVFILLPLVLWGLHSLQDKGKRTLYFITLTILFIQNYYFGFIIAIFISLYFFAHATWNRWNWRAFTDFLVVSILSALTAMIMLWPMYLDLKANGQSFSSITQLLTANSWGLDVFAKSFIGSYDTTQYGAIPMIYVGIFSLLLACCFFFIRQVHWYVKIAYGVLLAFIISSFYFQWLDLAWQGFHTPNMFLHRYSFTFSILIILLAFEALTRIEFLKIRWILILSLGLTAAFVISLLVKHYKFITPTLLALTLLFLLAYLILLIGYKKSWLHITLFAFLLVLFVSIEAGINGFYQISGVKKQWNYPSRSYYNAQVTRLYKIATDIHHLSGNTFVRTDNTAPDTANDGMKYNYNTIAQFSSVRNSNSSATMSQLGFQTDGEYLNLRYPCNTLLMDSIFDIKYNINNSQPEKFGYRSILGSSPNLSKNNYALSPGIFVPGTYQNVDFLGGDPIFNQTNFVNALAGTQNIYFSQIFGQQQSTNGKLTRYNNSVTMTRPISTQQQDLYVRYSVSVPAHSQAYIQVPNISYSNPNAQTMTVMSPESVYSVETKNAGSFFNLGYYDKSTTINVTLTFPQNSFVNFDITKFYALDIPTYTKTMKKIAKNKVSAHMNKNGATFSVNASKTGQLFLTIPYDKGWSATLDGKSAKLTKAQSGFMKLNTPKGKHTIKLKFFPDGLKLGIFCFFVGIILFVSYNLISTWLITSLKKKKGNDPLS